MVINKIIIILLLIMIIFILNFKRNKIIYGNNNGKINEHLTESGELTDVERNLLKNIISKYKYNNLTLDNIAFRNINANNLNFKENYNFRNLLFRNNLNNANLNVTNDISNNINISFRNYLSANSFNVNNIYSDDSTFNTIGGEITAENISTNEINTNNFCIEGSCITQEQYNNIKKYINPQSKYMYLPNTPDKNDQYVIWEDLFNKVEGNVTNPQIIAKNDTMDLLWQIGGTNKKYPVISGAEAAAKNLYRNEKGNTKQQLGTGIEIKLPEKPSEMEGDFSVLWVQVLGDRINSFRVYEYDFSTNRLIKDFGSHITASASAVSTISTKRMLNTISPDGTRNYSLIADGLERFVWWPVPIDLTGNTSRKLMITGNMHPSTDITQIHYTGLAFSKNPWNHCPVNHLSLYWNANTDTASNYNPGIEFRNNTGDYYYSIFKNNITINFKIPFVNSKKDKVFYIIECNKNDTPTFKNLGIQTIPGTPAIPATLAIPAKAATATTPATLAIPAKAAILATPATYKYLGGLYTTFNNPFAKHYNSRPNQRYYGVIIPKEYLPSVPTNFLELQLITDTTTGGGSSFTEVGTHDL